MTSTISPSLVVNEPQEAVKASTPKRVGTAAKPQTRHPKSKSAGDSKVSLRTSKKETGISAYVPQLLAMRQMLRARVASPVICTTPILTQNGEGIIWPHTITVIQGQTGTHKSRVTELICSVLIAKDSFRGEAIGLALGSEAKAPYSVCYVDTERNLQEQLIQAIQKMKKRAGYEHDEHPAHFDYNSLLEVPRTDRLEALRAYLEYTRREMSGHLVIVLDQLADCVADFNDPKESMLLTDLLNLMANQQDVTFICIIHENPGGSKARGHLGTELANKASTVLQVGFIKAASGPPSEVLQIKYIKRRSGAPNLHFNVRYDAEQDSLVLADKSIVKEALDGLKKVAVPSAIIAELGVLLAVPLKITELKTQLVAKLGGSAKTMGARLDEFVAQQTPVPNTDGEMCILHKDKVGKLVMCQLKPAP